MKKELYDHADYKARVAARRELNRTLTVYGPLRRLSKLLFWSVIASLVTAVSQLSIGLWPDWWTAALCLIFALATVVLLLVDLILIRCNLTEWFSFLEEAAKPKQTPPLAAPTPGIPSGRAGDWSASG